MPALTAAPSGARNTAFRKLKPPCVALGEAILSFRSRQQNGDDVIKCLSQLLQHLRPLAAIPNSLDHKLADYVFFPISQTLSASQQLPMEAMETCLLCLNVLLASGWQGKVDPDLSSQLLILLSLTADRSQKSPRTRLPTDDLRKAAFSCFTSLFEALDFDDRGRRSLVRTENMPTLGHAVTVLLDGISEGESYDTQLAASQALCTLLDCLVDVDVLASFLPGITSTLSKVLTPNTQARRQYVVLVRNLQTFSLLLKRTVSDNATASIRKTMQDSLNTSESPKTPKKLDESWLEASAGQIKLALANINRLMSHARYEVKSALLDLNLMVLSECLESLPNCRQMTMEASLILIGNDAPNNARPRLELAMGADRRIVDSLQTTTRDWTMSLNRIMQSNDDASKERRLRQLFTALGLLTEGGHDTKSLYRSFGDALLDAVTTILRQSTEKGKKLQTIEPLIVQDLQIQSIDNSQPVFSNAITKFRGQQHLLDIITDQLNHSMHGASASQASMDLAAAMQNSTGEVRISAMWLLVRLLDDNDRKLNDVSAFLTFDDYSENWELDMREELYSVSLSIIEDDDSDWRLKALALEAIALQARKSGLDFRNELVDALYPILHQLGSGMPLVRNHAMTCLNVVSKACEYTDAKDLLMSNVDYLVNAVALKLNAFDVSPQGPQVLLMMVKLAGPSLLPYLEDTVESIFAALEDYHGYSSLVELLFLVLKTMAEEGVRAPQLAIAAATRENSESTENRWSPTSIDDLARAIKERRAEEQAHDQAEEAQQASYPKRPWRKEPKEESRITELESEEEEPESSAPPADDTEPGPPAPKTYALLLKITQLTQHYLSSSSPALRTSLMDLITTTIPALARHEDSFLPLVNLLWPELVSRLQDDERHIVAGSLNVIAIMSQHARSFMRTRIQDLWPDLIKVHSGLIRSVQKSDPGPKLKQIASRQAALQIDLLNATYIDTSTKAVWQALQALLLACVEFVGVDAEMFDQVLSMMRPLNSLELHVMAILEAENADAVWLAKMGESPQSIEPPTVALDRAWTFAQVVF